ncbi:germin-like protein subfamily 1 member 11 [Salvia miltiorrhiza]|uniref:germin-like protein subfamily 1 member 11 n=1 Tax=Salvia miltiorrhiza TaxID=226208 RepID=UPI0025ABEF7E|nr:germin-like protein subfamily 1 member 11 [Salvia miltiorrhiza]
MIMKTSRVEFLVFFTILVSSSLLAEAYDPNPLQDFCIAVNDTEAAVFVNGKICKDPKSVTADDLYYAGALNESRQVTNSLGTQITLVYDEVLAGLNTQGVAIARLDFDLNGLNPPHEHPRGSEIFLVLEGTLYVGLINSNPANPNDKNPLFAKVLNAGDIFVFPRGLIHFQYNIGKTKAVAIAAFNSQNPGVVTIGKSIFGSEPSVPPHILAKAFQLDDDKLVEHLQSLTWTGNVN